MAEQQKYKRPEAPTKDQKRQMLAEAVRDTQPELNLVQKTEKGSPKRRSRKACPARMGPQRPILGSAL
jgi:hypothetical protein